MQLLCWNAIAFVFHLDNNLMVGVMKANFGGRTSRMPVNVGEALLHEPKDCSFHLTRQPTEIVRTVKVDCDLAPLRKPIDIPAEGRG